MLHYKIIRFGDSSLIPLLYAAGISSEAILEPHKVHFETISKGTCHIVSKMDEHFLRCYPDKGGETQGCEDELVIAELLDTLSYLDEFGITKP